MFFLLGGPGPEKWESATFKRSSPKQFVMSKMNKQSIHLAEQRTKNPFTFHDTSCLMTGSLYIMVYEIIPP